jgi:hypothetical protein
MAIKKVMTIFSSSPRLGVALTLCVELQTVLDKLYIPITKKAKLSILENVSGIVKPGR